MISTSTERRPLLLGHRGARRESAENTLDAFDLALQHACDGFEFDVRGTLDGHSIICHDPRLNGLAVAKHEYAALSVRVPSACCLEDVLTQFAARSYLDIELKVAGMEQAVLNAIRRNPPQRGYVVSSFLVEVLQRIHHLDPGIPTGFICDRSRELARWTALPCTAVIPNDKLTNESLVSEVHDAGKQLFVWTVNDQKRMRILAEWGVDGIISDDTRLLARTLRG